MTAVIRPILFWTEPLEKSRESHYNYFSCMHVVYVYSNRSNMENLKISKYCYKFVYKNISSVNIGNLKVVKLDVL